MDHEAYHWVTDFLSNRRKAQANLPKGWRVVKCPHFESAATYHVFNKLGHIRGFNNEKDALVFLYHRLNT